LQHLLAGGVQVRGRGGCGLGHGGWLHSEKYGRRNSKHGAEKRRERRQDKAHVISMGAEEPACTRQYMSPCLIDMARRFPTPYCRARQVFSSLPLLRAGPENGKVNNSFLRQVPWSSFRSSRVAPAARIEGRTILISWGLFRSCPSTSSGQDSTRLATNGIN